MAHDVFISYSTPDKTVADAVCATLEGRKIRCWIAPRDVSPGVPYAEALIEGLKGAKVFVLVFSENSNKSPQVMREVERAVDKSLPIIPLRIEDVKPTKSMEYFLSAPHWLDALTPPLEKHLQKLADTVQMLLKSQTDKLSPSEPAPPTPQPAPKVKPARKLKPVYILTGVIVIALIIAGVLYLAGVFGIHDEGKTEASLPGPTSTLTSSPTTTSPQQQTTETSSTTQTATTTTMPTSTPQTTVTPTQTSTPTSTATPTSTPTTTTSGNGPQGLIPGTSLKGELSFAGKVQWYTFYAEAGDAVYIVLVEGEKDSPMYPWLGLLDPDGDIVYENYYSESVQIDCALTKTGTYTVRVRDHSIGTGPYVLAFSQRSKTNNPLPLGSTQGQLTFPGEVHWYTFDAQEGDAVYIVLVEGGKDSPMYPWLGLLDPDGDIVYENYYSESVQIDCALTKTGTYTVRVRDHSIGTGPYVLAFSQLSKTSNPLPLGSTQGELTFPGEVHWYTFDAKAGDSVYIVLMEGAKDSPMYPWLGLLDPDGNVVYENYYSESVQIDCKLTKTGKYTVRVRDHSIGTGPYVLSFNLLAGP
jgi:hypothetical protein